MLHWQKPEAERMEFSKYRERLVELERFLEAFGSQAISQLISLRKDLWNTDDGRNAVQEARQLVQESFPDAETRVLNGIGHVAAYGLLVFFYFIIVQP